MGGIPSPLQIAAFAGALVWPLAAGLGVVFWSKARAAARARRLAAVDEGLQSLYRELENRPPPARLGKVVEALEEGEALTTERVGDPSAPAS